MLRYIIASIEGIRHDLAPEFRGKHGKVYRYGGFDLIIYVSACYDTEYDEAYREISDHCTRVNDELKHNRYYKGWMYAQMLTPNERHEYNGSDCHQLCEWLATKIIHADRIITYEGWNGSIPDGVHEKFKDDASLLKAAQKVTSEMINAIHLPGEFLHNNITANDGTWMKDHPIFEFGYCRTFKVQVIDQSSASCFKKKEPVLVEAAKP